MAEPVTTANIRPGIFFKQESYTLSKAVIISLLTLLILSGFWLRATQLSAEGLSEDEWKKLQAVEDYRAHGLTASNGEHPLLLKGLLTLSFTISEYWNTAVAESSPLHISTETAIRLPVVIVGALTSLLIFFVASELFGKEIGLIAAALWAFDPAAIGFNRIAKEDSLLVFFFLLANVFWLRGQRVAENREGRYLPYCWATAVAYGAMVASKYLPYFVAISGSYYHAFVHLPKTRFDMGKKRWFLFFLIMGLSFVLFNPAILLPDTWHVMEEFVTTQKRVGYDVIATYEYLGHLYPSKMVLWLNGVPWHFYYVFMLFKLPVSTLIALLIGLPLLLRKQLGDGRIFIFFWLFFWFFPFSVLGGKFTRYFVIALPAVLITAAIAIHWIAREGSRYISGRAVIPSAAKGHLYAVIVMLFLVAPALAATKVSPYYRLYTNVIGGGEEKAGSYFPHDEFFDGRLREAVSYIAANAGPGARYASETPRLAEFYARRAGRDDLIPIWLSDKEALQELRAGDYVIVARGRRYFSNDAVISRLHASVPPVATMMLGRVPAIYIFKLDEASLAAISDVIKER